MLCQVLGNQMSNKFFISRQTSIILGLISLTEHELKTLSWVEKGHPYNYTQKLKFMKPVSEVHHSRSQVWLPIINTSLASSPLRPVLNWANVSSRT